MNLVGETLDAAFGQEGDSDEEDAIVNQVLDEIGISFNEKVCFYVIKFVIECIYLDGYCSSCSCWNVWYGLQSSADKRRRCRNRTNVSESQILNTHELFSTHLSCS
jgi:hypothetical protein